MNKCHICDIEVEDNWVCERCGESVCEDCCVPFTIHNQIDYTLCTHCGEMREIEYWQEINQQEEEEDEKRYQKEVERWIDEQAL